MKNVKATIKAGMIIKTEGYLMFTIGHPLTGKLITSPIIGGPVLEIEDNFDDEGKGIDLPDDLNIVNVYKFKAGFDYADEFDKIAFNNIHTARAINDIFDSYIKIGILIKVA